MADFGMVLSLTESVFGAGKGKTKNGTGWQRSENKKKGPKSFYVASRVQQKSPMSSGKVSFAMRIFTRNFASYFPGHKPQREEAVPVLKDSLDRRGWE